MAFKCFLFMLAAGVVSLAAEPDQNDAQAPDPEEKAPLGLAEISTVGLDMLSHSPVVLLRHVESGQVVPIWVGLSEAQAIARALHGIKMPRPMTHDLLASMIEHLGGAIEEVVVHDFRDGMYFGMIRLKQAGKEALLEVDSRPSDAMALALRVGAPIQLAKKVLEAAPDFDFMAPDEPEQVVRAMGITVVVASPALRREFELGAHEGVVVSAVTGLAEEQGLQRGDLIIQVNGAQVTTPMEFFDAVRKAVLLGPVEFKLRRGGEEQVIEIPVELPPEPRPVRPRGTPIQV